jgi:transcriptional regulator with XRE-family HTH domain
MSESSSLSTFLQERRARIAPETLGLPPPRRRSRPGLRREDVAELVDVTLYWYGLFESGTSGRRFSAAFLTRLADVLGLDDADRVTLLRLASATGALPRDVELLGRQLAHALA